MKIKNTISIKTEGELGFNKFNADGLSVGHTRSSYRKIRNELKDSAEYENIPNRMSKLLSENTLRLAELTMETMGGVGIPRSRTKLVVLFEINIALAGSTMHKFLDKIYYSLKYILFPSARRNDNNTILVRHDFAHSFSKTEENYPGDRFTLYMRYGILYKEVKRGRITDSFLGYVENFLRHIGASSWIATRCIVIMDNVMFFKAPTIIECVNRNGHEISFFLSHSTFLNPYVKINKPENEDQIFRHTEEGMATISRLGCDDY
ncbi:hypothetical protein RF11_11529 [Thelohanellus kitauei]|uniref:Tc1-like transposase DDE domain-containing protein n=1 Tax=Thelohanellus kitauei TaxID=669202 RepID=A0A0C2JPX1_THEKT|nr:hypothetical protein RF11_11529 [Thelohanellus kitauei]